MIHAIIDANIRIETPFVIHFSVIISHNHRSRILHTVILNAESSSVAGSVAITPVPSK